MIGVEDLLVCHLGTIGYADALELQEQVRAARKADAIADTLLLLEHPPVYTRGRRSEEAELPLGEDWYAAKGIEIVDVRRGGKVTYHGPGQLIAYPIVRVGDVLKFVRLVEDATVAALAAHGVEAHGRADEGRDFTGVWIGEGNSQRKIASIGLHVTGQVTAHGLSVNVNTDLEPFGWIVPCGLPEAQMTSIALEGGDVDIDRFADTFAAAFSAEIGELPQQIERAQLDLAVGAVEPPRVRS
jgi:lipoyl(octanoyl) transferase